MTTVVNLGVNLPLFLKKNDLKRFAREICFLESKRIGDLSFVFTDDDYLLEVNKRFLQHDYYTDVITFDYGVSPVVSGDVMISLERVRDNAQQLGCAFELEFFRVCFHGVLHLCGYKDKTKTDEKTMRQKEDQYLKMFVSRETNQS
ncbi:MAG: rRNA maturation RNase YbeY [Sphingomonadales bacterium]